MKSDKYLSKIRKLFPARKKLVFVHGKFNILHPGHFRLLRFASECGDYLIVGVYDNSLFEDHSLLPVDLRIESLKSTTWVNYAFPLKELPELFIRKLKPAVVVKGNEFEGKINPELSVLEAYGGKLLFGSGDISFSSLQLLRSEVQHLINLPAISKPMDFMERHGLDLHDLKSVLQKMEGLRVCIFGETIIDEYLTCAPLGMSQEDPTIVVTPVLKERFIGGAAIVAAHAKGLGADVQFFSVTGDDEIAHFASAELHKAAIECHLFKDNSRPTTLKQRFRTEGKTFLRVNHLRQHTISSSLAHKILSSFKCKIKGTDLVVFADFNYGVLPQYLVDEITDLCSKYRIKMAADSQSSSQIGDISRYKGMHLITSTEREARLAVRDFQSGLVTMTESLRKKTSAQNIIVKLGAEGILIHSVKDAADSSWSNDRLPALNLYPKDTIGAGDSLLTCTAMAIASGGDIWGSSLLGSLAAAYQVGKVGNVPINSDDILNELKCF